MRRGRGLLRSGEGWGLRVVFVSWCVVVNDLMVIFGRMEIMTCVSWFILNHTPADLPSRYPRSTESYRSYPYPSDIPSPFQTKENHFGVDSRGRP
jgi:hypothetical protein